MSIKHQKYHLMINAAVGKQYFLDESTSSFLRIRKGYSLESPLKSIEGTLEQGYKTSHPSFYSQLHRNMCTHGLSITLRTLICQSQGRVGAKLSPVSIFRASFYNFSMLFATTYSIFHRNFSAFVEGTLYLQCRLCSK